MITSRFLSVIAVNLLRLIAFRVRTDTVLDWYGLFGPVTEGKGNRAVTIDRSVIDDRLP